ncbi:hypothetical protein ZWY2020_038078 [Hordeum vulgare]|nr:hypothetical protein ZWY2020_038078 [Hordeum vulgare]
MKRRRVRERFAGWRPNSILHASRSLKIPQTRRLSISSTDKNTAGKNKDMSAAKGTTSKEPVPVPGKPHAVQRQEHAVSARQDDQKKAKGPSMKTSHVTNGSTVNQQPPHTTSTAGDKPEEAKGNGMSTKGAKGPRG